MPQPPSINANISVTRTKNAKVMGIFLSSAVACDILLMSGLAAAGCVETVG
jgi:hypothetical protein